MGRQPAPEDVIKPRDTCRRKRVGTIWSWGRLHWENDLGSYFRGQGSTRGLRGSQFDPKFASSSKRRFNAHTSAESFDGSTDDGQPDTSPGVIVGVRNAFKDAENAGVILGSKPNTVVVDLRWTPKVGQAGSLAQTQKNDPNVQETSSAQS